MRRLAIPTGILLCLGATYAFACWQVEQPPIVVRTVSLVARVTENDAPRRRLTFSLHKAITFDDREARKQGAYEKQILKSATTDSAGVFSFGEVKPGHYWIVPLAAAALSDSIAVEVVGPDAKAPHQRLWVKYFADGCRDVLPENVY